MTGIVKLPFPQPVEMGAPSQMPEADGTDVWLAAWRMIRRRLWLIASLVTLICLLALPAILALPKLYHAESRVMVTASPALALAAEDGRAVPPPTLDTEIERMLSNEVIDQVIADLKIATLPEFDPEPGAPALLQRLDAMAVAWGIRPARPAAETVQGGGPAEEVALRQRFRDRLTVARQGSGTVVTIGFTSRDPRLAQDVPTALLDAYRSQSRLRHQEDVRQAGLWMSAGIEAGRARMAEDRAALDDFMENSGLAEEEAEIQRRLALIETRQSDLEQERFLTRAEMQSVAAAIADRGLSATDEPEPLQRLRWELAQERREMNRLSQIYGDRSTQVTEKVQRVTAIETMIGDELQARLQVLRQRAEVQDGQARQLAQDADGVRMDLAAARTAAPVAQSLTETLQRQQQALSRMEDRYDALMAQGNVVPVVLDVLHPSTLLKGTVGPSRKLLLAATAVGGLFLALFAAAVVEMRDTTVRGHEQLALATRHVPVGLWPRFAQPERQGLPAAIAKRQSNRGTDRLRDAILMLECANGGRFPKILTVTAPDPGDMADPVAEWLALELAAQGRKVRLVKARGGEAPGTTPAAPLLLGAASASEPERVLLSDPAWRDEGDGLALPRRLVQQAQREDVLTIIDAPPILSGSGLRTAREGGEVLLVLRWGHSRRKAAELASALLARIGATQVHTLITNVDQCRHRLYGFQDRLSLSSQARS